MSRLHFVIDLTVSLTLTRFARVILSWHLALRARCRKLSASADFAIDDGLTVLERRQTKNLPEFLTGSAKSQADKSTIVGEIEAPVFGGLSQDRFQLLFISVFGLLTLVGSLSGAY